MTTSSLFSDLPQVAGLVAAGILLFDRVARFTSTKADDRILGLIHQVIRVLAADVQPPKQKAADDGSATATTAAAPKTTDAAN